MPETVSIVAVLLTAVAVLPGTLGILMLTNRIAASPAGARYIYSQAGVLIVLALGLAGWALFAAGRPPSAIVLISAGAIVLLLVYGFLMHAKLLFRPVRKPRFIPIDEALAKFRPDEEVVGVIDGDGTPYAFVARLARRPHVVYQPAGDSPFIMTHCILAHSSMSYALEGSFRAPDITITAAIANNMVFYDKSNRCSVVQIHNRLEGRNEPLQTLPTVMTSLGTWRKLYPGSPVWMRPREWRDVFYLKLLARAEVIDPSSPVMVYPLQHPVDERLPLKSLVLGISMGGVARAYPVETVVGAGVINDELGGTPLTIFCFDGDYLQVFDPRVEGAAALAFSMADRDGHYVDSNSGSTWDATGNCIEGRYSGNRLAAIPHYNKIFWYVWSDYFPRTEIFRASDADVVGEHVQSASV